MPARDEVVELIRARIKNLRIKLLDLSRRNPLISTRFSARSTSHFRVVDELPDTLCSHLVSGQSMRLAPLPSLDEDPRDEEPREFQDRLSHARLTNETFLQAMQGIDAAAENAIEKARQAERNLRDFLRHALAMPPRQTQRDVSLVQHARNNHISPSYDLPLPSEAHADGRHADEDIQTLLLPDDLERKMHALVGKSKTWMQETGINVLYAAFGFLEWLESEDSRSALAPLVLLPIEIETERTRSGPRFWIKARNDELETNTTLAEKLRLDFGILLPSFEGGSIEEYLGRFTDLPAGWSVRRQIAVGVFPSARMAMYEDLDADGGAFDQHALVERVLAGSASAGAATPYAETYEIDAPEVEAKVPCLVIDADSSQFSAIVDVMDGTNLSVEGPPGTGKSQTIVNTIAASLAAGKKVLFVAEKTAALNVVKSRLEAVGLGEFVLPLQADRASREQVVQSVRERLEIDVAPAPRDYDAKLARFRETRAQIKDYIDVVSQKVGKTGLTVYEVLGKSLVTGAALDSCPESLQSADLRDIARCSGYELVAFKEAAKNLSVAWVEAEAAAPHWSGLQLAEMDRFVAEKVGRLARSAAEQHRQAAADCFRLESFGINPQRETTTLHDVARACRLLQSLQSRLDPKLLRRLLSSGHHRQLIDFVEACKNVKKEEQELGKLVVDPGAATWPDRLRELRAFAQQHQLWTLDAAVLEAHRSNEAQSRAKALQTCGELQPFVAEVPEGAAWSAAALRVAKEIVDATPRVALALRTQSRADPSVARLIQQATEIGTALRQRRDALGVLVHFDIAEHELAVHAASLRAGGVLSFVSRDYRQARRIYLLLSQQPKFERQEALTALTELQQLRSHERRFNSQMSALFGVHFKGLDTDFEPFLQLVQFYEAVDRELPGSSNRSLRQFLKVADSDLLYAIPAVVTDDAAATFKSLAGDLQRIEVELPVLDQTIRELRSLSSGLRRPDQIQAQALSDISSRLADYQHLAASCEQNDDAREALREHFAGAATPAELVTAHLDAANLTMTLGQSGELALQLFETAKLDTAVTAIEAALASEVRAATALEDLSALTGIAPARFSGQRTREELAVWLESAAADVNGLREHAKLQQARARFKKLGGGWIVDAQLDAGLSLSSLEKVTEAVIFRSLSKSIYQQHGSTLGRYPRKQLDSLRNELAALDREIIELSRAQLRASIYARANPPVGIGSGRRSSWTERSLLENEVSKTSRFTPVRDLTRRASRALLELKPCWMMSPLAVAQYLAKGVVDFDLVIIDEASQMPPEDALGALVRSRQAMIVGDTHQLPPSSFFRKMIGDEEADEDETVLEESILDMANAAFRPVRRLRWHYRSRESALINFSNHYVYDNDLIVFPSAEELSPGRSVTLQRVTGQYASGTNPEEAKVMIEAAIQFMKQSPDRSLGLVVLNQKQRDLLLEEMERALSAEPQAQSYIEAWSERRGGLEEFFIKNLENVQGDERDVIFIGTVYGPAQPGGPVMQRFGPINGIAGKRRLNVLFSRAKHAIRTFSSMSAADIKAEETGNVGAYMLKCWLEYAATGTLEVGSRTRRPPDSDFEVFVMEQISAMGCEPVPQVGAAGYFIDIAVKHPDWPHGYILAVECDGAAYHSAKSARDRDRLRQQVLEDRGWHFHRVWSTDWFNDPRAEAERLRQAIQERLQALKCRDISPVLTIAESVDREVRVEPDSAAPAPRIDAMPVQLPMQRLRDDDCIRVGDRVRVRYLSGGNTVEVTLSEFAGAPERGVVGMEQPLGRALLGAQEGEEIEVLVGSYIRKAVIERVHPRTQQVLADLTD